MHPYARAVVDLHSLKDGTHPNAIALQQMDLSSLSQYFHLRINDVARKLGVCATVLKKVCRKHGIPRWPQRKLASIDRRLAILKRPRRRVGSKEARRVQHEIDFLATQRDLLLKDPAAVMGTCGNEDSKCPFEQEIDFSNSNADTAGNNAKNGYMFKSGFSAMYGNFLQSRTDDEDEDFDEDDEDEESLDDADANSNQHNKEAKTSAPNTLSPLDHAVAKSPLRDFMTRTNTMGGMHKNYSSDSLASLQSNTSAASMNLATLAMASTAMLASPSPSLSRPLSNSPSTTATLPTILPVLDPQRAAPLAPPLPHLLPLPADVRLPSLRFAAPPLHNPFSADNQCIHAPNHQQNQDRNHEKNHDHHHHDNDDEDDDDDDDDEIESDYDSPLPTARPAFSALLRRCGSFPALNVSH